MSVVRDKEKPEGVENKMFSSKTSKSRERQRQLTMHGKTRSPHLRPLRLRSTGPVFPAIPAVPATSYSPFAEKLKGVLRVVKVARPSVTSYNNHSGVLREEYNYFRRRISFAK